MEGKERKSRPMMVQLGDARRGNGERGLRVVVPAAFKALCILRMILRSLFASIGE